MSEWQPIESAPEGEHVLVWNGDRVCHSYWGKVSHVPLYGWLDLYADCEDIDLMEPRPTHWQPLPEPPRG